MFSRLQRRIARTSEKLRLSYVKRHHIAPLLDVVPADAEILEIGGGYNPRYLKSAHAHVYHLDHSSTEDLRAKYAAFPATAHLVDRIQQVDFVFDGSPIQNLVPASLRFDLIYGSHVLEHQVDLIGHLQSLEQLLKPAGRVVHVVPDLRTCFDALRFPSVTSDAIVAHLNPSPVHQGKQVFDYLSREININHGFLMRDAHFEDAHFVRGLPESYAAMAAAKTPGVGYADTHAWTFTPESFRLLMIELRLLGMTRLQADQVSPRYGNQFCAVLSLAANGGDPLPEVLRSKLERERLTLALQLRIR
jgi:SAM-dependent methyltransferase